MRKALDRVYEGSCVIAALFVLGILVVVLLQVGATMLDKVMVWLTGEPIGWFVPSYAEFTGYFRGVSGWLALAFTFQAGNHIRVSLVIRNMHGLPRQAIELFCVTLTLLLVGFFSYQAVLLTMQHYKFGDVDSGSVAIPLWLPQTAMAAGLIIMTAALAGELWTLLKGKEPSYGYRDKFAYSPGETEDDADQAPPSRTGSGN